MKKRFGNVVICGLIVFMLLSLTPLTSTNAATAGVPVNPNATQAAKNVLSYLYGLSNNTFNGVVAGQNLGHGTEASTGWNNLVETLENNTGKYIGLVGLDYEYIQEYASSDLINSANPVLKNQWNNGGLVTINWSPTNPWGGDIRDKNGANLCDLVNTNSSKYNTWRGKLNRIATALTDLKNAGVVVLWRPMQEMNGTWFWWGKYNNSDAHSCYVDVYRDMYNYFTNTKGLNNLLWVFSPTGDQAWSSFPYPGDDYVDIVAGTSYNDDLIAWGYNDYAAYGKVVGMAEFGPADHGGGGANGNFDNRKYVQKMSNDYPKVAYWTTWHDWTGVTMSLVNNQYEWELLNHNGVYTRDELNVGGGNLVQNAGFEGNAATQTPSGWQSWGGGSGSHVDADYTETTARSGTYRLTHAKGSAYEIYTYQSFSGLANGNYTMEAWVMSGGGQNTAIMNVKNYGGSEVSVNIPQTTWPNWQKLTISNVNVTNGQATIGFYSNSPAGKWLSVDDVRFYKQ